MAENAKWLDSIEGKTYQFTNALETMWSNMIDSETVKDFIDFGTDMIQFLDTVPGKITAIVAALAGVAKFKGYNPLTLGTEALDSFKNIGSAQATIDTLKQNLSLDIDLPSDQLKERLQAYGNAVSGLTPKLQANMLATNGLTKEQIKYAMTTNGIEDKIAEEAIAHTNVTKAKNQSKLSSEQLVKAKIEESVIDLKLKGGKDNLAAAEFLEANASKLAAGADLQQAMAAAGLTEAQQAAVIATMNQANANKHLALSFKTLIKMNPAMVITAIGTAAMAAISWIKELADSTDDLKESYDSLQNSISSAKSEIDSIDSELSTIQDQINELSNKNLTLTEADELQKLKEQSAELERQKELQESVLKARTKQNEAKSLAMINNMLGTTAANQEKAAESGVKWGKAIGAIVGIIAGVGAVALAPFTGGGSLAAGVGLSASLAGAGSAALTAGIMGSQIGSNLGEMAGGAIGSASKKSGDSLIGWYESYEKAIAEAEADAAEAEAKYLSDVSDKNYEKWQKKVEAVNTLQEEMYHGLEEMQSYINNLEYNDQTAHIIDGYNDLMTHLDVKADGGNINSQISSIESLAAEYEELSKGVDANGKNVALSAEEYARYCNIVEQVLGYAPNLIQSYNDEGEAIFNRNSLIQDSIDLLKEQQRLAAIDLVNDDTILSTFKSSKKNYEKQNEIKLDKNVSGDFKSGLEGLIGKEQSFGQTDESYILEHIDVIRQKWSEVIELARQTEGEEFAAAFRSNLQDIFTQLNYADGAMSQFKQSLFAVPQTSEYYYDLSGDHLKFINSYINTFDNLSDLTEDEVLQVRNSIFALTEMIGSNEIAQGLVESLFKADSSLPVKAYVESINDTLSQMVNQGFIDEKTKEKLFEQFVPDAENIDVMLEAIGSKLSDGSDKLQDMNLSELKIAYKIVADADPASMSFKELQAKVDEYSNKSVNIAVPTLSSLIETTESLNEIINQTAEITVNNTKVTQDYKDALIDLVGSEEEVNKYFDENNSLIVKDAKGLNNLVKTTKKNTAASAALAKTQARLQYYELYQEIKQLVGGQAVSNAATLQQIVALYHEMNALEKTIARYSVLEEQLLGAANAYEKFAKAQEIDSQTDYIASAEDMVLALGQAFNTAELGTETAQTAIAGLVPESVYEDLNTVDEKMAAIHKYFKEGKIAQYFDLEFDDDGAITSVEMKLGNLRKFIEDGLAGGVFAGADWQHFDLSEDITSLEEFADQMGVTKEVAFAFLKSLEDHDIEWLNGDYTSLLEKLLPENLENKIHQNTSALADLEIQMANGEITAEEYATTYAKLASEEATLADRAREEAAAWYDKTEQLEQYKTQLQEYQKQLETGKDSDGNIIDPEKVQQNINEVTGKIGTLKTELADLEEPTELTLQIALEDIQEELDTLEKTFEDQGIDIKTHLVWDAENSEWKVSDNSELKGDKNVQQYVELSNDQSNLESLMDDGIVTVEEQLSSIIDVLKSIYVLQGGEAEEVETGTEDTEDDKDNLLKKLALLLGLVSPDDSLNGSSGDDNPPNSPSSKGPNDNPPPAPQVGDNNNNPPPPNFSAEWDEFWGNISIFFDGIGEQASALKEKLSKFFTETVPEKWNEFWDSVSEFFAPLIEQAKILREKVTAFFTETIPEKWDEFWIKAGEVWNNIQTWADTTKQTVVDFFTITIPEKWSEFWDKAGEVWDNVQTWAEITKDSVVSFFTETLPEKWDAFWEKVDTFFTENIPYAIGYAAGAVVRFFTETIPQKWDEFWDAVGETWDNVKDWAGMVKDKVVEFFTQTIPNAWSSFLDSVGAFIDESVMPALASLANSVKSFFTETIPQKWDEFWGKVGEMWDNVTEWASSTKEAVVTFFTQTIPNAWSSFWTSVKTYIDETIIPALQSFANTIKLFFTETIPTKWNEFWSSVGSFITETIVPALQAAKDKVVEFFTQTIPAKWSEFWSSVGTFLGETVPQALENVKEGVTTFFTVTLPGEINGLWGSIKTWIVEKATAFWENLKAGFSSGKEGGGDKEGESGTAGVNGTAHAKGTVYKGKAYKSGDWGLPQSEHNSLVGELGPELVWKNSQIFV